MRGLAIFLLTTCFGAAEGNGERPNLVVLLADDMSWDDCSPYGHPEISTPNLQRLADSGMRFDNAILTISSCSPSRCSILTGRYPHQTGAEELHWPLPENQITFAEELRRGGYWTGAAGKWHLGDAAKKGFDRIMEVDTSGFQLPAGKAGEAGKFVESLAGEAQSGCADWVALLRARDKERPFFVWLAALDPHRPYHEGAVPRGSDPSSVRLPPYHPDSPKVREDYALYYDEIRRLDRYVGEVLDELDAQGISESTFVLFLSDNGRPFPRDKTTVYDSGIKTPFLAKWPGKIQAGSVSKRLVSAVDIATTLLDIAGLRSGPSFQGRSFLPVLRDPARRVRTYAFAEKNWHDFEDHVRAVRSERFKYIRNGYPDLPQTPPADAVRSATYEQMLELRANGTLPAGASGCFAKPRPREELYDLSKDPHEMVNLANSSEHGTVLAELRTALTTWEQETGDYVPRLRTADEFDRETGKPTPARVRPRRSRAEMVRAGLVAP